MHQQCGRTFHETVRELVPGAAERWVKSMHSSQSGNNQASTTAFSAQNRVPSATAATETATASNTEASRGDGRLQDPKSDTHSEPKIETSKLDPPFPEYILICVKQKQRKIRMFANNIKNRWTDKKTFISIKETYESNRANWWRLNALSHVEFKKVFSPKTSLSTLLIPRSSNYITTTMLMSAVMEKKRYPNVRRNVKAAVAMDAWSIGIRCHE